MKKLVIVINDEDEDELMAVQKARQIADSFQLEVEVVRFIPQASSDTEKQSATQSIHELTQSVYSDRPDATSQVAATDSIPQWMAEHFADNEDTLVVITGHHRSQRMFHTPTDWSLIRQLHCPVMINCDHKWKSRPNVMVALDLSTDAPSHRELNALALRWARQWESTHDCQLHAMYCVPIPAPLLEFDIVERHEYQRSHDPEAKDKLIALLNEHDMSQVTPHIEAGTPEKSISSLAGKLKADLVIMGGVGREGIQRLLHHNTTEKVLHYLRTDLLVVRPSGASR